MSYLIYRGMKNLIMVYVVCLVCHKTSIQIMSATVRDILAETNQRSLHAKMIYYVVYCDSQKIVKLTSKRIFNVFWHIFNVFNALFGQIAKIKPREILSGQTRVVCLMNVTSTCLSRMKLEGLEQRSGLCMLSS